LLLARDRLGIKPLYYGLVKGRFVFASELKAILQLPAVDPQINWTALDRVFTFLSTPASESIIEGLHKLEPGCILSLSDDGRSPAVRRYWDLTFEPVENSSEDSFVARLQALLHESVGLHMVSDVPVGAFLSGGVDSSSVVAAMARMSSGRVRTFSIGFHEDDYSELQYARMVAKALGTEHHELVVEPNVLDMLEDMAWHLDEPFGDSSAIPTYMVSKLAAEHVKVVLSGDGGDELFAGYDKYAVEASERNAEPPAVARRLMGSLGQLLPEGARGRNFLRHRALAGTQRYLDACSLFRRAEKAKLFDDGPREAASATDAWQEDAALLGKANGHWLSALQYLDLKRYLPLDILTKVDRMSMAHSLEVRVPLLDHRVVEFAASVPPTLLWSNGSRKHILKRAVQSVLPAEILHRKKQGFAIPLGRWFRGQLDGCVREILLSHRARQRRILRPEYIERLLALHQRGKDLDLQLWTLISFEMWCRTFLDGGRPSKRPERPFVESQVAGLRPAAAATSPFRQGAGVRASAS
jgi:asparagine synthase (glutamine-hydrolysing)